MDNCPGDNYLREDFTYFGEMLSNFLFKGQEVKKTLANRVWEKKQLFYLFPTLSKTKK